MTGTFINVGAILAGTAIGVAVGSRLEAGLQQRVIAGLGLVTAVIGVDLALAWRSTSALYVLGAVLLGGLVGEALAIEDRLARLGDRLQARVTRGGRHSTVSEAFDGIPITAPARTLLDIAPDLTSQELAKALEIAQVRCLLTKADLQAALDRAPRRPGTKAIRALIAEPAFTRSKAERMLLALLRAAKLPRPAFDDVAEGYEVDVLWSAERVTLEFDSYAFHATRAAFERDRARDADLTRAGYLPLRTTWHELNAQSHALVARLAQALAAARRPP